jgi:hypothetical protein
MSEHPIKRLLIKIEPLRKTLLHYVTFDNNTKAYNLQPKASHSPYTSCHSPLLIFVNNLEQGITCLLIC